MSDYETRAQTFGLASADELKRTLQLEDTILLDVRNDQEIEASAKFEKQGRKYVQAPCTPDSCEMLSKSLNELLPNKKGEMIIQLIFCRRRHFARSELILILALSSSDYHLLQVGTSCCDCPTFFTRKGI
jgi:hypothetical protein